MSYLTNDQYLAISSLEKWYRKYNHQIIEIGAIVGTGVWDVIQQFIESEDFDPREVMYLSYNQKQVLELAAKRYHAYYLNGIIYNYTRIVDFDTIPVINPQSTMVEYEWKKSLKKKINKSYKLIVVFDSVLMSHNTLKDLASFGLPIIMVRDPMLLPAPDSYTFTRDPNIVLREPHPDYMKNPITYFAHKVILGERLVPGNYDTVSIVPRKQMNLYNIKSSDMNITMSDAMRDTINHLYRERVLKLKDSRNVAGERLIVTSNMYAHKLVNPDEKNIKVYLMKGLIGHIARIYKHQEITRFVYMEFRPEFYFDVFEDLMLDRYHLNQTQYNSRQQVPDEYVQMEYAYALTPSLARLSHWDKVTMITDPSLYDADIEFQASMMYTAITRAKKSLTLII